MAVAISAVVPSCPTPSLRGRSRLSRASGVPPWPVPPELFAGHDDQTTPLMNEEPRALMRRRCELLPFSDDDDDLPPPPLLSRENLQLQAQLLCSQLQSPPLSLDNLNAPVSEDDVDVLAPMFSKEEIRALRVRHQASPRPAGTRSDDQVGEKRRWSPPWPSCISDDVDDPPPPPVKRARTKIRSCRPRDNAPATRTRLRRRLREWHKTIARCILGRQFRAPELSRGRTALGCQCHELALADSGGGGCALHQDVPQPEDRAWIYSAQGRFPLVGGPGEVLVPTLSAGHSKATVVQYARWRRGVRMPTRFYVENAVQQRRRRSSSQTTTG